MSTVFSWAAVALCLHFDARSAFFSLATDMHPFYTELCTELGWTLDEPLANELSAACAAKLVELDQKIDDAEKNLGESEIRDAMLEKAEHYALIGDKV